jgi:hypothetical protein
VRWKQALAVVLGSAWFFPVSCTTATFFGTHMAARLDEREVARGDSVHSQFSVAAEPGEAGRPFRVLARDEIDAAKAKAAVTFRMSRPRGAADIEQSKFSYHVLADTGQEQLIELVEEYRDGDNTVWSRYRATSSTVSPVSSRMFHFSYMFAALPFAFGLALVLYFAGLSLRRRIAAPDPG